MIDETTNYYIPYDFEYDGEHDKFFCYDLTFDDICAGIRHYGESHDVVLDGTDTDLWNLCVDLEVLDKIIDLEEDFLKELCREVAYEKYKEQIDDEHEDARLEAELEARYNTEDDDE